MSTGPAAPFVVETVDGAVERLLDLPFTSPLRPTLRVCRPTTSALVLGSVQPEDHVDAAAAARSGVPVVRRCVTPASTGVAIVVGRGCEPLRGACVRASFGAGFEGESRLVSARRGVMSGVVDGVVAAGESLTRAAAAGVSTTGSG